MDNLIATRNLERNRVLEGLQQAAHDPAEDPQRGYQQNIGSHHRFQRFSQLSSEDDDDDPEDPDDPNYSGAAGQDDFDDAGRSLQGHSFQPTNGERMFIKETSSYKGNVPFDSYLRRFSHLADFCTVRSEMYKSTLYMKISGPVGALINDMVPDRPKYAAMTGKQYANAIKARLEPVTEKRLLYQQFLARTQQTGESVDLYVLDKHNLFRRSSVKGTRNFEDFIDYTIRGFINPYLKKKVRESCVMKVPKTFVKFREMVNINVTLIQSRLQSGEIDATEATGCEVRLFSYSYVDSGAAGSKGEATESSSRYFPSTKIKEEPVSALIGGEEEADDEAEDNVNWVGRKRNNFSRSIGQGAPGVAYSGGRSGGGRPKFDKQNSKASDTCHHCGQIGHWKGECPRRLHGFPKSVNAVDGTDSTDDDEGGEVNVVKAGRTAQTSQIALLSERVDKLFDMVGKGKSTKPGNTVRYPMKADPQRDRNDGVSFLA